MPQGPALLRCHPIRCPKSRDSVSPKKMGGVSPISSPCAPCTSSVSLHKENSSLLKETEMLALEVEKGKYLRRRRKAEIESLVREIEIVKHHYLTRKPELDLSRDYSGSFENSLGSGVEGYIYREDNGSDKGSSRETCSNRTWLSHHLEEAGYSVNSEGHANEGQDLKVRKFAKKLSCNEIASPRSPASAESPIVIVPSIMPLLNDRVESRTSTYPTVSSYLRRTQRHTRRPPGYYPAKNSLETKAPMNFKFFFDADEVRKTSFIGTGALTKVYRVEVAIQRQPWDLPGQQQKFEAALKVPKNRSSQAVCKQELMGLLSVSGQQNVLTFLGIVHIASASVTQNFLVELCELGTLNRLHNRFDLCRTHYFNRIAQGLFLGLLHLHLNGYIHRDIACRNILVKSNWTVVIGDFSLAVRALEKPTDNAESMENRYHKATPGEPLPWQWMSPESLKELEFSFKSDVWAAGVTLWEVVNKGKVPYDYSTDYKQQRLGSRKGALHRSPENVTDKIKDIIRGKLRLPIAVGCPAIVSVCLQKNIRYRPNCLDILLDHVDGGYEAIVEHGTSAMQNAARNGIRLNREGNKLRYANRR
eukprot:CAMPEP_0184491630 /NCGR_PEP_ID=MMETSP0113_2-20130426/20902_1 /TAXON_ID=91329 /ORGANISM="Norrisiella sphaerica, Strain BC52" /LENGTH=588 /DNA_ID=CAMNT_0026876067 /DNA_START=209 /DNA_END=1978 /DNA_ORIENTATION=+